MDSFFTPFFMATMAFIVSMETFGAAACPSRAPDVGGTSGGRADVSSRSIDEISGQIKPSVKTVNVTVVFETYCADSINFIIDQFWPVYQELKHHLSIELLPHGKASQRFDPKAKKWKFHCQHGAPECRGNRLATCAIAILQRDVSKYLPFIKCFEEGDPTKSFSPRHGKKRPIRTAKKCWSQTRLPWKRLRDCFRGEEGVSLQLEVAKRTPKLSQLTYVPWIYINGKNGQPLNQNAETDLKGVVCGELTAPKPVACGSSRSDNF